MSDNHFHHAPAVQTTDFAATIASMTSQWGTHWGALSNQKAALLVLASSNYTHDINWMKLDFLMDEIIIFTDQNNSLLYLHIKTAHR